MCFAFCHLQELFFRQECYLEHQKTIENNKLSVESTKRILRMEEKSIKKVEESGFWIDDASMFLQPISENDV